MMREMVTMLESVSPFPDLYDAHFVYSKPVKYNGNYHFHTYFRAPFLSLEMMCRFLAALSPSS